MAYNKTVNQNKNYFSRNTKNEVRLLRSFVMSMVQEDKEGRYNQKFIREMLKAVREKPIHFFSGSQSFLKELR